MIDNVLPLKEATIHLKPKVLLHFLGIFSEVCQRYLNYLFKLFYDVTVIDTEKGNFNSTRQKYRTDK